MAASSELVVPSDAEDDEEILLFLLLRRRRRRRQRAACRTTWTKPWVSRRYSKGAFCSLVAELNAEDPENFRQYHRLDRESFNQVLAAVESRISKQDTTMRFSISPGERLSVTLRFLASGETFKSLSFQYRIGERTISSIVTETCEALYQAMKEEFLKTPASKEEWLKVAGEYERKWQYPFCLGAIDGKHIRIQQPSHTGSEYFNYKSFFSVLMIALVDARYKFLYVDVGSPGRAGDAGVFSDCSLKNALISNSLNIPTPVNMDESDTIEMNYHIVADDAFPMSQNLMKPYPHRNLDKEQRIFNYRLSRARRTVENAFGIFANRFRIFLTTIKLCPEKVTWVVLAACCLHNFMVEKNKHTYMCAGDVENSDYTVTNGTWREDPPLLRMSASLHRNAPRLAKEQRQHLANYFSGAGAVPWQETMISL